MIKRSIYTSGAIEFTKDAYSWRNHILRELHNEYDIIIPDMSPCPFNKTDSEYGMWIRCHYILPDMKDVAVSTHFFVKIDHVYSSGTYCELALAAWLNKDIVCYLEKVNKLELPLWVIGCLTGATFVNSIQDGVDYYKSLCK